MRKRIMSVFSLMLVLVFVLTACAAPTPQVITVRETQLVKETQKVEVVVTATPLPGATLPPALLESPVLAEQVKAGKLPPLADRLPQNPMVMHSLVETGKYGGTLRQGIVGTSVTWGGGLYTAQWENLVQWTADYANLEPSAAESVVPNEDATEYTINFRKGMKWSDGEPFGPDDVLFYLNDVLLNAELNPGGGADWLGTDFREGFKAEKLSDTAVKVTFPKPYGTFPLQLATWGGRYFVQFPKHYLQQFHIAYNDKANDLAKSEGYETWVQLFFAKGPDNWGNPDRFMDVPEYPSVGPWVVVEPIGAGTTARFVRNPYYWKVDENGSQLPYIDEVIFTAYQDNQTRTLAMLNGDLDFIKDPGEENREVYFDALLQDKPINILPVQPDAGNTISIHFNRTSKDPVLAEIFANKDFRIGMSHAINRMEIIEIVFKGQGEPAQVSPLPSSPLYNEQLATQFLDYDLDKANAALDKVLPDKDAEGMRLRPDGKKLSIIWTCLDQNYTGGDAKAWLQAAELMVGYFKAVGVEVKLDIIADSVFSNERRTANDVDMFIFHGGEGGPGLTAMIDPRWHVPGEFFGIFGLGWYNWLADPANREKTDGSAVEPPEEIIEIRELYGKAIGQPTVDQQISVMKEVLQTSADNFWIIGISRQPLAYQPTSNRLRNVPENAFNGWLTGTHKIWRPEQWFLSETE